MTSVTHCEHKDCYVIHLTKEECPLCAALRDLEDTRTNVENLEAQLLNVQEEADAEVARLELECARLHRER